ncbi:unnamed protein product, partial [Rotaria sp. Silwood1]
MMCSTVDVVEVDRLHIFGLTTLTVMELGQ